MSDRCDKTDCPTRELLVAFSAGALDDRRFAAVAQCVERCGQCQERLQNLQDASDPVLRELRRGAGRQSTESLSAAETLAVPVGQRSFGENPPADAHQRLGRYVLLEQVGGGSFGSVWRAHDSVLDRTVALKVPRLGRLDENDLARFAAEAQSVAKLRHPGIVMLHDVGEADGVPYLVSEFIEGETLAERIAKARPGFRDAVQLVLRLANALEAAHRQHVIHRDVKPSNILIDASGMPKLTDFGLAKREATSQLTQEGDILGTPAYMSPEQADGRVQAVDARSDVCSTGAVLYELLTGEVPFRGNVRMVIHQVIHHDPRPPRTLDDTVPRDLETICLKAMAKEPARRYQSARELADDLSRWLEGRPITARPAGAVERSWRWCRRNRVLAGWLGTVALALIGIAALASFAYFREAAHTREIGNALTQTDRERRVAQEERDRARLERYGANLGLAHQYWQAGSINPLIERLRAEVPGPAETDLREFTWRYLWRLQQAPGLRRFSVGRPVRALALSPDGGSLAVAGADGVAIWNLKNAKPLAVLKSDGPTPAKSGSTGVTKVRYSPDGTRLITGHDDGKIRWWNSATAELEETWEAGAGPVKGLALSADGKRLFACGTGRSIRGWDVPEGTPCLNTEVPPLDHPFDLAVSPDGATLAVRGGNVLLLDLTTNQFQDPLLIGGALGRSLAFASQEPVFAVPNGTEVQIWDARSSTRRLTLSGHAADVKGVRFSPDGKTLASWSHDQTIKLWDAHQGLEITTLRGHRLAVEDVIFTADGRELITAGSLGQIVVYATDEAQDFAEMPDTAAAVRGLAFVPGSHDLAVGAGSLVGKHDPQAPAGELKLWDVNTSAIRTWQEPAKAVNWVRYSGDGKTLAAAAQVIGQPGIVELWDMPAGKVRHVLKGASALLYTLSFSRDGTRLVTASGDTNSTAGEVIIWEVSSGRRLQTIRGPAGAFVATFAPSDDLLAVAGFDNRVRLYDLKTGKVIKEMPRGVCDFSPDGALLAVAVGGGILNLADPHRIEIWDVRALREGDGGKPVVLAGHAAFVGHLAFAPDFKTLATTGMEKTTKVWNAEDGKLLHSFPLSFGGAEVAFASANRLMTLAVEPPAGELAVWDLHTGKRTEHYTDQVSLLYSMALAPRGGSLVVGTARGELKKFDAQLKHLADLKTPNPDSPAWHAQPVLCVVAAHDGKTLFTGGQDQQVKVWDQATGQVIATFSGHTQPVVCAAISPSGALLVTGSGPALASDLPGERGLTPGEVIVWEVSTGKALHTLTLEDRAFTALAISPDGVSVAAATRRADVLLPSEITLWDVNTGAMRQTLQGDLHKGPITCLAFVPEKDGFLISGGRDQTLRLWDLSSGTLAGAPRQCDNGVYCLAFSADGKTLATGMADGVVRLWHTDGLRELIALKAHRHQVRALAFSSDGALLATGAHRGLGGEVRIWRAPRLSENAAATD